MDFTKRHSHPGTTILLQFFNVLTSRNTDIQEITDALAGQEIPRRSQNPKFLNGFQKTVQPFVYRPRRSNSIP